MGGRLRRSRAGRADPANIKAWRMLADKVLVDNAQGIRGHGIILEAVPKIQPYTRWANPKIPYQQADLVAALAEMFKADPACARSDGYQFDVVNLTRQVLGNHAATVHARMMRAYEEKDLAGLPCGRRDGSWRSAATSICCSARATNSCWDAGWPTRARWAANPAEARYYERNARQIITTWHKPGGELSDYAHRQWNGLLRTYYLPRWQEFIARLDKSLADNQPLDAESYDRWRVEFEAAMARIHGDILRRSRRRSGNHCPAAVRKIRDGGIVDVNSMAALGMKPGISASSGMAATPALSKFSCTQSSPALPTASRFFSSVGRANVLVKMPIRIGGSPSPATAKRLAGRGGDCPAGVSERQVPFDAQQIGHPLIDDLVAGCVAAIDRFTEALQFRVEPL